MRKIDRFDQYMRQAHLNDNKVTLDLGLSVGTIGKSRKEGRDLSPKVIERILNFYTDLSKVWLLTGEGDMILSETRDNKMTAKESKSDVIIPAELAQMFSDLAATVRSQQETINRLTSH